MKQQRTSKGWAFNGSHTKNGSVGKRESFCAKWNVQQEIVSIYLLQFPRIYLNDVLLVAILNHYQWQIGNFSNHHSRKSQLKLRFFLAEERAINIERFGSFFVLCFFIVSLQDAKDRIQGLLPPRLAECYGFSLFFLFKLTPLTWNIIMEVWKIMFLSKLHFRETFDVNAVF